MSKTESDHGFRDQQMDMIQFKGSDLIANGDIKLKSEVSIAEIKPNSVVLTDGVELKADAIVRATGYGSMNGWAGQLINQEVADKVGKCWGARFRHHQRSRPMGR